MHSLQLLPHQLLQPLVLRAFAPAVRYLPLWVGNTWAQKANFGAGVRSSAVGFSIGSKGYVGTGIDSSGYKKDFWEYDPSTNAWTQKADFGGGARAYAVGFSIGSKGYVGTGAIGNPGTSSNLRIDFWEYDPSTNVWTNRANFGGGARAYAVGFSTGSKGYVGTGFDGIFVKNDFWEYNPSTNAWTQKAGVGGGPSYKAVGFSIGSKGYMGIGAGTSAEYFWEYDPSTNVWTQKADVGGGARDYAVGFSIGNKGYVGTGLDGPNNIYKKDFWEYDPSTNVWTQKADFGGVGRYYAVGFSIGSKGYLGTGPESSSSYKKDFWEYDPGYTYSWSPGGQTTPSITVSAAGNYMVTTTNVFGCSATSAATVVTENTLWNEWNGTVSTAWEDPANWSCGIVPDVNTKVYITSGKSNYPVITSMATCKSISIAAGTSVRVTNGYNLDVKGP